MSEQKMREALNVAINWIEHDGCQIGWSLDRLKEALSQREAVEPFGYTKGDDVILAKHWTADFPPEGWQPLYTAPPSREVPEEWVELVRDLLSTYDQRLPLRERPDLWNIARALLASKGGV